MRNGGRTAAVLVGVIGGCGLGTQSASDQGALPAGWRVAQPNESITVGTYTLRAPAKSEWGFKVSTEEQTVVFQRVAQNVTGQLLAGTGPRVHNIKIRRGTVPDYLATASDSAFAAESLFEGLLVVSLQKELDVRVKTQFSTTTVDGRTVYRLKHDWSTMTPDLTSIFFYGVALVSFVHRPDDQRIWYLVDGDVANVEGGGAFTSKPDEEVLRAMLLSIAEATSPLVP